jgi:hypothetical protein
VIRSFASWLIMAASPDPGFVRLLNECANYAMSGFDGQAQF